ncbi:MAG: hypothetical protein CEN91_69 [Candidatus Berkelbacteria bacterium Licking1014_85]|uniref:Transposase n=1 Tax=Candidatus Berkelbacteria bacterium Licking1014_85 TaxID=2017148 RepID=A0A554LLY3_9BACT|nr:MAG: hypothetical protein CEN91_69 [Candidatus Berkelbacteria bacterium Licking1014_85]
MCRKTWRIRHKKVGRKHNRVFQKSVIDYLSQCSLSSYRLSRIKLISEDKLNNRLTQSRDLFLSKIRWSTLPRKAPLVVVADAMMQTINHKIYCIYLILVKKPQEHRAIIVKPLILPGLESQPGWKRAFDKIPPFTLNSIEAIVCDGHIGLVNYARRRNWIIQRCHFHILAAIQGRRSKSGYSRHQDIGKIIYQAVYQIIHNQYMKKVDLLSQLFQLEHISQNTHSKGLARILRGFITNHSDYLSYVNYPKLNLPTTTNAAESTISGMRNLLYRAKGFRTLKSLELWIFALLKYKKSVSCNGHLPTKFLRSAFVIA